MTEVTIRTENEAALQKLLEFISIIGFQIVSQKQMTNGEPLTQNKPIPFDVLPIQWAEEPDVLALSGIWEKKDINLEQIRKEAWGNRL